MSCNQSLSDVLETGLQRPRLTGCSNTRSLAGARLLRAAGKRHELRFLMVQGHADSAADLNL